MRGIKSNVVLIVEANAETCSYVPGRGHDYVTEGIDRSCDASVGRA